MADDALATPDEAISAAVAATVMTTDDQAVARNRIDISPSPTIAIERVANCRQDSKVHVWTDTGRTLDVDWTAPGILIERQPSEKTVR